MLDKLIDEYFNIFEYFPISLMQPESPMPAVFWVKRSVSIETMSIANDFEPPTENVIVLRPNDVQAVRVDQTEIQATMERVLALEAQQQWAVAGVLTFGWLLRAMHTERGLVAATSMREVQAIIWVQHFRDKPSILRIHSINRPPFRLPDATEVIALTCRSFLASPLCIGAQHDLDEGLHHSEEMRRLYDWGLQLGWDMRCADELRVGGM
jgi:hypothetical protein